MTFQIVLGALLHDIGKFAQRAGERLDQEYLSVAPKCCPPLQDGFFHHHAFHGAKFVQYELGAAYPKAVESILTVPHARIELRSSGRELYPKTRNLL